MRLNMAHASHQWVADAMWFIREVSTEVGRHVSVMMDVKGPEIRTARVAEAIEHLRSTGERPDLLLVDINMPGTDGFEFLRSCQKDSLLECSETTVVMCSSSNHPTDLDMARQQPCISEYIEKPLTTEQFARIAESIGQRIQGRNQT